MKIHREDDVYSTVHCTGPTFVRFSVRLAPEPEPELIVEFADAPPRGNPSPDIVRAAAISGAQRANAKYDASFHPTLIRCSIDHYRPESILDYLTFKIVEFAAVPDFASSVQRRIVDSSLSFHKLAAECGVSKSVLSSIAKSGSFADVDQKDAVTLIEHFHLRTGG